MKKLNLYLIRDMARNMGRAVYSMQQLANLIKKPKKTANVYAMRLVRKNLAKKVLQGKISFSDDEHVIAGQLIEPSYVSLFSALLFHQLIKQVPPYIHCVTTKNTRNYERLGIVYHKIPPTLFCGYKIYKKDFSYVMVADPEKAAIDAVYLNLISKDTINDIKPNLDKKATEMYLKRFSGKGRKKIIRWLL